MRYLSGESVKVQIESSVKKGVFTLSLYSPSTGTKQVLTRTIKAGFVQNTVKRAHSIAQTLDDLDKSTGYRLTGSFCYNQGWAEGKLYHNGQWTDWVSNITGQDGRFPDISNNISWTYGGGANKYKTESDIKIHLQ